MKKLHYVYFKVIILAFYCALIIPSSICAKSRDKKEIAIGIVTNIDAKQEFLGYEVDEYKVASSYIKALLENSDENIIIIPLLPYENMLVSYLNMLDGLLVMGSNYDVDPTLYGQSPEKDTHPQLYQRTAFNIRLIKMAQNRSIPILGICYGMQFLNVIFGGTLFQNIPNHLLSRFNGHPITFSGSEKLNIEPKKTYQNINSLHHQAVDKIAPMFKVIAKAADGHVEAIESKDKSFILGVQWHPELQQDVDLNRHIFQYFYYAALKHKIDKQ